MRGVDSRSLSRKTEYDLDLMNNEKLVRLLMDIIKELAIRNSTTLEAVVFDVIKMYPEEDMPWHNHLDH